MQLSVIIPAYKEAENLSHVLPQLTSVLKTLPVSSEVLVIDSRQPLDNTKDICAQNNVTCISRTLGDYYGAAVQEGIQQSKGNYVIFMDADGSHPPEFIAKLFENAAKADIVIASRYMQGGGTENPFFLMLMSRLLNIAYGCFLGMRCSDVSNSLRLYNGDLLRSLTLRCHHFDMVEEILVQASLKKRGLVVLEIPFTFKKRLHGDSKREHLVFYVSLIKTLFRLAGLRLRERFKLRA